MDLKLLEQHLRTLALAPPAAAPVVSCYVNRESPDWRGKFDAQAELSAPLSRRAKAGEGSRKPCFG